MTSLGPFVADTQADQHAKATGHRPFKPAIPGDHRCPQGACAIPPPPPPVSNQGHKQEQFTDSAATHLPPSYWALLTGLTVTLALLRVVSK
jgi:hypothetical protein